jgi:hypothetical protein
MKKLFIFFTILILASCQNTDQTKQTAGEEKFTYIDESVDNTTQEQEIQYGLLKIYDDNKCPPFIGQSPEHPLIVFQGSEYYIDSKSTAKILEHIEQGINVFPQTEDSCHNFYRIKFYGKESIDSKMIGPVNPNNLVQVQALTILTYEIY